MPPTISKMGRINSSVIFAMIFGETIEKTTLIIAATKTMTKPTRYGFKYFPKRSNDPLKSFAFAPPGFGPPIGPAINYSSSPF